MMNPEIKAKWLERLRSGEIEQGTGFLAYHGTRCCLGVLCDLAVEAGIATVESEDKVGRYLTETDHYGCTRELPDEVSHWAGLLRNNPLINTRVLGDEDYAEEVSSLAEANDGGYTFNQIADIIAEEL